MVSTRSAKKAAAEAGKSQKENISSANSTSEAPTSSAQTTTSSKKSDSPKRALALKSLKKISPQDNVSPLTADAPSTSRAVDTKQNAFARQSLSRQTSQMKRLKMSVSSTEESPLTDSQKPEANKTSKAVGQRCHSPPPPISEPIGNWKGKPWQQWDKYDCLQWIQVYMPYQSQLNALRANEVDGKKLEELIQFDMEVRRAQRDESSVLPKSPMPGVTWTGVRALSGRFWPMVTDHLKDINTKEYYQ